LEGGGNLAKCCGLYIPQGLPIFTIGQYSLYCLYCYKYNFIETENVMWISIVCYYKFQSSRFQRFLRLQRNAAKHRSSIRYITMCNIIRLYRLIYSHCKGRDQLHYIILQQSSGCQHVTNIIRSVRCTIIIFPTNERTIWHIISKCICMKVFGFISYVVLLFLLLLLLLLSYKTI